MALLTLEPQVNGSSRLESTYVLEGRRYGFRWYNTGETLPFWYLDVFDSTDPTVSVVTGLRVSVGVDLLFPYRYNGIDKIPPGILFCQDVRKPLFDVESQSWTVVPGYDPVIDSFSTKTHQMFYLEST